MPFTGSSLVTDGDFRVLDEAIPTLLSMKDMVDSDLDISLEILCISFKGKAHALSPEHYSFIHL